jgi:hypothetical protein
VKKLTCDICGKEVKDSDDLRQLLPSYQTKELKEICIVCDEELRRMNLKVTELLYKLRTSWMQRAIDTLVRRHKKGD